MGYVIKQCREHIGCLKVLTTHIALREYLFVRPSDIRVGDVVADNQPTTEEERQNILAAWLAPDGLDAADAARYRPSPDCTVLIARPIGK